METSTKRSIRKLVTGLAFALVLALGGAFAQGDAPLAGPASLTSSERNTIAVAEMRGGSVVAVNVVVEGQQMAPPGNPQPQQPGQPGQPPQQGPQVGTGSGFLVDDIGGVVTNLHVIARALQDQTIELREGAEITVSFPNGGSQLAVAVIGANPDIDMALLRIQDTGAIPDSAAAIPFGDSDEVLVGQKSVAIGNPFRLRSTVTVGNISAIEREAPGAFGIQIPFMQTDAAVNSGNSGGPLLDSHGRLIGINNAILSPSGAFAGVGFAVPSNLLRENLEALQRGGVSGLLAQLDDPNRAATGITGALDVSSYPPDLQEELSLPDTGVVVTGVQAESPAAEAGLIEPRTTATFQGREFPAGVDVITAIEGEPMDGVRDIQRYLVENAEPGDTVTLSVWRDGETREVDLELVAASELQ